MLTKLRLENFQKHKSLTIDIGPGVTSIVGPTEAGKSAILRALTWVCRNRGAAGGFITHGESATKVTLEVDGYAITRRRTGKGNHYELADLSTGEVLEKWSAVRSDVPARVAEILATPDVCFQEQHDSPFWLGDSAGEVGRAVNAVVDLTVIDTALTLVNSMASKASVTESYLSDQLKEANTTLAKFAWVEPMGHRWDSLVKDKLALNDLRDIETNLETLLTKATTATREAKQATALAERAGRLLEASAHILEETRRAEFLSTQLKNSATYKAHRQRSERAAALREQAEELENLDSRQQLLRRNLSQLADASRVASSLKKIQDTRVLADDLVAQLRERKALLDLLDRVDTSERSVLRALAAVKELEEEIAAMPEPEPRHAENSDAGTCPTCGRPFRSKSQETL